MERRDTTGFVITMNEALRIARVEERDIYLLPQMANRHGLITGASGTGKTITLQVLAEKFSRIGVPVFVADVKGDLAGLSRPGEQSRALERATRLGLDEFEPYAAPVTFWDVFGKKGHPIRATVSEMGPLLLSRLLGLTQTQRGALNAVFQIADAQGLLLLDVKDLRAMLDYVGAHASEFRGQYGNLSRATLGAIQRNLLLLNELGAESLFGEPSFDLFDFLRTDENGRGMINLLAADQLIRSPQMYATILLWLLALLFATLPEVGDLEKPKLVFFFDEAHLLFSDTPKAMVSKIEQMVRLIRSKGVGVYFVSQSPSDIPEIILGQLGNRVQHALRAFTPHDQRVVRAAAQTFRSNPSLDLESAITNLAVGEALISFLDDQGMPEATERAWVLPPHSYIGPVSEHVRYQLISQSLLAGKYEHAVDRESAYELLQARAARAAQEADMLAVSSSSPKTTAPPKSKSTKKQKEKAPPAESQSAVHDITSYAGQRMTKAVDKKVRGIFGSFWGASSSH